MNWRLLMPGVTDPPPDWADGIGEAAWNMAVDEALLGTICEQGGPPTLRLYVWRRPAITIGRFQSIERTMNVQACQRAGVPYVRRLTGGRGVLHGADLTVAVVAPISTLGMRDTDAVAVVRLSERLATAFRSGLARAGVRTEHGPARRARDVRAIGDCFQDACQADLVDSGSCRKVMGAAIYRRGAMILQQVSVPWRSTIHDGIMPDTSEVFMSSGRGQLESPAAECEDLADALVAGFAAQLGADFRGGALRATEKGQARAAALDRYSTVVWTHGGHHSTGE
jgi:lipoate-protein ligase A